MPFRSKPGGQPGNQNARKHGFYSRALTSHQRAILRAAARLDPTEVKHEISLLRARIAMLVEADPDNITVLTLALNTLVKLMAMKHRLSDNQQGEMTDALRDLIDQFSPGGS
ncbi:MAG: hypothetical protein A2V63_13400 [Candidatus Eisenbacteria bacterium RBG_19FT_COMBO_70_11]|nr:MAG: hypothetical protein A2V63_13400 [Candidatus Eisenbacteria bacterium RBG_19FT_COMBO_70_11]